jgi:glycosyltransferase involved in cell wall biosynthesis
MGVDFAGRFSLDFSLQRVPGQILFVGRLVEKKGVKYLIQALPRIRQRVPNAHLVIVGSGPDRDMLFELASTMGLLNSIQFVGAISQVELPGFYRRASVFVAPFVEATSGDREGLGLVTAEAIASGCPVVVGDVAAVADIFLDGALEMRAVPGNVESLVEKVVAMLLAPEAASQQVLTLRHRLVAQLGWDAIALQYASLLREVAGAASTTR